MNPGAELFALRDQLEHLRDIERSAKDIDALEKARVGRGRQRAPTSLRDVRVAKRERAQAPQVLALRDGNQRVIIDRGLRDIERGELLRDGAMVRLTSGEMEMLRLFARNPGTTVGRAELLAQSDAGNVRAVDVQITRLRRKIEEDPKEPRHLCTVWGQGYVFWLD